MNSHFKCLKECASTSTIYIFKKNLVLLHLYPLPLCYESSRGVVGMMGLLFKPPHLHFPGRFFFVVASTMKFHGSYHLLLFSNFKWYTLYTFLQKLCHYFWNCIFCEYVASQQLGIFFSMQFLDFKHLDLALICELSLPWRFNFIELIRIVYYPNGFPYHFFEKVTI